MVFKYMAMRALQCVIFCLLISFFSSSGVFAKTPAGKHPPFDRKLRGNRLESTSASAELDDITPTMTVPTSNPTTSTPITPMTPVRDPTTDPMTGMPNTKTDPMTGSTSSTAQGQNWCIVSQAASDTVLQVALDYACGYGGADCSAIQTGSSCYNPDTIRDHASYAFNDYYQKNPVPTSCDFGGAAVLTNTDPSTQTCQYPSTSTSSSGLNPTDPSGSPVYGKTGPPETSYAVGNLENNIKSTLQVAMMICSIISHL